MKLQAGKFLKSTDLLNDTVFAGVIIFITEHNRNGAAGFIINKPFGRSLHHLEAFKHGAPFPLHNGGPVDGEHLFILHKRPDIIDEAALVDNCIYFGGNFKKAVTAINNKSLALNDIKIFVGYCGWDAGELEAEIAEGSWVVGDEATASIFE